MLGGLREFSVYTAIEAENRTFAWPYSFRDYGWAHPAWTDKYQSLFFSRSTARGSGCTFDDGSFRIGSSVHSTFAGCHRRFSPRSRGDPEWRVHLAWSTWSPILVFRPSRRPVAQQDVVVLCPPETI